MLPVIPQSVREELENKHLHVTNVAEIIPVWSLATQNVFSFFLGSNFPRTKTFVPLC